MIGWLIPAIHPTVLGLGNAINVLRNDSRHASR
jgi:hypothetical protein